MDARNVGVCASEAIERVKTSRGKAIARSIKKEQVRRVIHSLFPHRLRFTIDRLVGFGHSGCQARTLALKGRRRFFQFELHIGHLKRAAVPFDLERLRLSKRARARARAREPEPERRTGRNKREASEREARAKERAREMEAKRERGEERERSKTCALASGRLHRATLGVVHAADRSMRLHAAQYAGAQLRAYAHVKRRIRVGAPRRNLPKLRLRRPSPPCQRAPAQKLLEQR
eukprot:3378066-Pleurochrysis_carterae.AAC.2